MCPDCKSHRYIMTNGKKQCLSCGYEEETMSENPALFKTRVDQKTITKRHKGCDNTVLRLSRIKLRRGRRSIVYVCGKCYYEEERLT